MPELRIVVEVPDDLGRERRDEVLGLLASALQDAADLEERPSPLPDIDDDGNINPMFLLSVREAERCEAALRSVGAWYMKHPDIPLVLRATGRGGRVALQLKRFSTIAFAEAVSKIHDNIFEQVEGD